MTLLATLDYADPTPHAFNIPCQRVTVRQHVTSKRRMQHYTAAGKLKQKGF